MLLSRPAAQAAQQSCAWDSRTQTRLCAAGGFSQQQHYAPQEPTIQETSDDNASQQSSEETDDEGSDGYKKGESGDSGLAGGGTR